MKIIGHPVGVAISPAKGHERVGVHPERIGPRSAIDDVGTIAGTTVAVDRSVRAERAVSAIEREEIGATHAEQEIGALLADDLVVGIKAGEIVGTVRSRDVHIESPVLKSDFPAAFLALDCNSKRKPPTFRAMREHTAKPRRSTVSPAWAGTVEPGRRSGDARPKRSGLAAWRPSPGRFRDILRIAKNRRACNEQGSRLIQRAAGLKNVVDPHDLGRNTHFRSRNISENGYSRGWFFFCPCSGTTTLE